MKKLLIGLAVAAMLVSCSKDETVEMPQSKAINFTNAFVNNGTRSIVDPSFTTATLENFNVYGFSDQDKIFNGTEVSNSGGTWYYAPLVYWFKDHVYTFGAIAPSSVTADEATLNGTVVDMTVNFANVDGTTDLLYAAPAQVTADEAFIASPTPVGLTFNHQLAKVKFTFANQLGAAYDIQVKNVKITDGWSNGTITLGTTNAWSAQSGVVELNFGDVVTDDTDATADNVAYGTEAETYNERLLIPSAADKTYAVTFSVDVYDGDVLMETYDHSITISGVELKLGYCYDFKATFTMENINPEETLKPIEFTVNSVEDWNDTDEDQTMDIPVTPGA